MLAQAAALVVIASSDGFAGWAVGSVILGLGTALVYPTLLAVIGDVAHPIVDGVVADAFDLNAAVWAAAASSLVSGVAVAVRMYETRPRSAAVPTAD